MSFQAMTWATAQRTGSAGAKLVLLMLANHANGHTGQCNPRLKMIADECEMSRSTVIKHIQRLEELGILTIEQRFAEGVQIPNQYWLNLGGVVSNLDGGGVETGRGGVSNLDPVNQEVKPGSKPKDTGASGEAPSLRPKTFNSWVSSLKANNEIPIPEDDTIFDYASHAGIPDDYLRLAWVEFRTRYAEDTKRYADWRAVFRRAVREDWFKLWRHTGSGYLLTSRGLQAMGAMNADEGGLK